MGGWNKGKTFANWNAKVKDKFGDSFRLVSVGEANSRSERVIVVECLSCGTIKEVNSISFRGRYKTQGHCDKCFSHYLTPGQREKMKRQEVADQIKKQDETLKKETTRIKRKLETNQVCFRFCECGAILAYHDSLCNDCKEKHKKEQADKASYKQMKTIWYKAEVKRKARLKNAKRDNDATLEALFKKYNGICYLCGEACDWKDGKWENGVFKVGGNYPSREHVIPVSKGGDDTWSNLRLAHVSCNSKKGAKLLAV